MTPEFFHSWYIREYFVRDKNTDWFYDYCCVLDVWTTARGLQDGDSNEKQPARKLCPPMENVPQPINRVDTTSVINE